MTDLQVCVHDNHLLAPRAFKAAQDGGTEPLLVCSHEQLDIVPFLAPESLHLLDGPIPRVVVDDDNLGPGWIPERGKDGLDERGNVVAFVVRGNDDRAVDLVVVGGGVGRRVLGRGVRVVQLLRWPEKEQRRDKGSGKDGGEMSRRERRRSGPQAHLDWLRALVSRVGVYNRPASMLERVTWELERETLDVIRAEADDKRTLSASCTGESPDASISGGTHHAQRFLH